LEGFPEILHREITVEEIQELVKAFGQAAQRVKEANFDAVQIHAAHGYLLNQFLSPIFNKRTDAYGGILENRTRLLLESLKSIRVNVGNDFPVLVKLTCQDFVKGGVTLDDSLAVGALLQREGIDAIELSGGMSPLSGKLSQFRTRITTEEEEAYFGKEAKMFKEKLHVPIILVGGIRSFPLAERLFKEGYTDYISMSRPFIREPFLIKRWRSGDFHKAKCISDNRCFEPILAGEGICCVIEKKRQPESFHR
jgi:2,4-dienoyl-CoA reductase-like NADH-dependent reductase (Old Yellow Enzyme family)